MNKGQGRLPEDYARLYPEARGYLSFRDRLRGIARHGILSVIGPLSRPSPVPALRLLYCHHVFDDERARFESTIDALMGIGEFISTADVLDVIAGKRALTRHAFHISFDDGFQNILANALPALRARSIPSLMFVATRIIDDPSAFPHLQRLYPPGRKKVRHASWAELEDAHGQGLEIGSHARSHPYLSRISPSDRELEDEVMGSREDLRRRFGACDYFSWPYGGLVDVDRKSLAMVERAGYRACFGAFRGQVVPGATDRFRIPRHHFEPNWPLSHVRYFTQGGGEV